jgi:asparagine synthase (glutamine-hydrolysing)
MCGIAGYVGTEHRGLGQSMAAMLRHRGPDEAGEVVLPTRDERVCALAHRRLSIIDIPGGHQPQTSEDGSVNVIFNGEIYNFRELRANLESRGHHFSTRSDTEVIVHLYEEYGDDCVLHLRGMFAFALWDANRERLLLARDRLGVKPLYYALPEGGDLQLAFASELKALFAVPGVSRELDLESLAAYLAYLYIPHPRTAVRGAKRLPPAHLLVAENGSDRGFAVVRNGAVGSLGATTPALAQRLLWATLALAEKPDVTVDWLTSDQQWAIDVALAARLSLGAGPSSCRRATLGPMTPYLPGGAYG